MRLCFVMPRAHGLATGRPAPHGGAELQMVRLARALAPRVEAITLVTHNPGGRYRPETVSGVHVVPAFDENRGLPGFRFRSHWAKVRRAVIDARPDAIVQRAASPFTGLLADLARRHGAVFVYMVSNDPHVDGRYEKQVGWRYCRLYRHGIRRAHGIVAQTEHQARLLKQHYGREALVLPSAVPPGPEPPPHVRPERVLWVGNYQRHKHPELVLELARRAPELAFAMAGSTAADRRFGEAFEAEAQGARNVTLLGQVPNEALELEYRRSIALLSTSDHEGFSNTFLEAWRFGVPVVSLWSDPDRVLEQFDLGVCVAGDLDRALAELRALTGDTARRAGIAVAAREYLKRHETGRVAARLLAWIESLVAEASGGTKTAGLEPAGPAGEKR